MAFAYEKNNKIAIWMPIVSGPILSLVVFFLAFWLDPMGLKEMSGMPAFFLSVIFLMIGQWFATIQELQKSAVYSDRLYAAIKNYLHVTPIGSPEEAFRYILGRMPALREVKNTSFNIEGETDRSYEKLYETEIYDDTSKKIASLCCQHLLWKDIGDTRALNRLRAIRSLCLQTSKGKAIKYKYKLINHNEPQINFIILEYSDGTREVLFNWDFRGMGQDPTVLISRDNHIVEMFTIQFNLLWCKATEDHDSHATKSTSQK